MGHKKKSKHKKKKRHSSTSSSSSASAEEWVEIPSKSSSSASTSANNTKTTASENAAKRDDWMSMPGFIPVVSKEKINEERNRERKLKELEERDKKTYKPGESDRELNPYWKNGGTGVPEEEKKVAEPHLTNVEVGDRGLEWLRKSLVRTQEQAEAEGRSLEDVAVERWGSLNKLYELIEEAEKQSRSRGQEKPKSSSGKGDGRRHRGDEKHSRSHRKRRSRSSDMRHESSDSSDERHHKGRKSERNRSQEYSSDSGGDGRYSKRSSNNKSRGRRHWDSSSDGDSEVKSNRDWSSRSRSRENKRHNLDKKTLKDRPNRDDPSKRFQAPKDDDYTFGNHGHDRKQINSTKSVTPHERSRPSWKKSSAETRKSPSRSLSRESPPDQRTSLKTIESSPATSSSRVNEDLNPSEETKVFTENELAAKMMKAEIMGNDALVAKLKKQLEEARRRNKAGGSRASSSRATEEVVVLTSTDKKGFTKPLSSSDNPYGDGRGRKRKEKVSTHQAGKRERYFADDDKYTLQNMFEREKLDTVEDSNALFAKLAFKSKIGEDDGAFDMEDVFMEQASRKESSQKLEEKQRSQAIAKHKQTQRVLESCLHCIDSEKMLKHTIIDIGNKCYLCVPSFQSLSEGHCLIVPSYHVACATQLDEEVWEEIQNYRKKITQLFLSQDEDVVFFETAMGFGRLPHMVLHCVPMPKEVGDMAPIYFKKAILESETEWAQNKKVVDLSQKSVRRAIPKGLPYFAVDFGLQGGFAHVIEDEKLWPRNFAQNIIGGMLDLDHTIWRKERQENFEDIRRKVVSFTKLWRDFSKKEGS